MPNKIIEMWLVRYFFINKNIMKEKLRFLGSVQEMANDDNFKISVPIEGVDIEAIKNDDKDPTFVVVEVMNPQISKNKNKWTLRAMESIRDQINKLKPDGYMGHLTEEERGHKSPESQTIWLGSIIQEVAGKPRLFAKGYILPYATKLKQYLRATKLAGKTDAGVSVYGSADIDREKYKKTGIKEILDFELESIDWARSGAKGTYDTSLLLLTSEMDEEENMDKETVISEMSKKDLEKYNSDVFAEVKTLGASEVEEKNKTAISEMETKVKTAETKTVELQKSTNELVKSYIASELDKKITNKVAKEFIGKMVDTELKDKELTKEIADTALKTILEGDTTKAMLKEMKSNSKFSPAGDDGGEKKDSDFIEY